METIIEFVKTNWLLTIGIVALIIYAVWDYVKRKKQRKQRLDIKKRIEEEARKEQEMKKYQRPVEQVKEEYTYAPREQENTRKEEPDLSTYFLDKKEISKEVSLDLKDFTVQVMNEKSEIEKHIKKQNEELKKELLETTKKKEEIKKQGIALATLFDKYREREEQLKEILNK